MKKTAQIILLLLLSGNLFSQNYSPLVFRKPTTSDNITWRFKSVKSGVDAYISVIGSRNASVERIDDSGSYRLAWNPFIRFTNNASSTDTSFVEFRITFRKISDGSLDTIQNFAMTAVDLDGNGLGSYREMFSTTAAAKPKGIVGSAITTLSGLNRLTLMSGFLSFASTDTSNFVAMSQLDFQNTASFTVRVGVVGNVTRNTVRQYSYYFKPFAPLSFVLPVKLVDFKAVNNNEVPVVKWTTSSEDNANRFEIYRSLDGINFVLAGTVNANGNTQFSSNYSFSDNNMFARNTGNIFYKLRIVDNDEEYSWSKIVHLGFAETATKTTVSSVYPNPSKGILNVSFQTVSENEFTLEVIDMFGKVHQTVNSSDLSDMYSVSLDLSNLSNGVYFVRINDANGAGNTTKFIKN